MQSKRIWLKVWGLFLLPFLVGCYIDNGKYKATETFEKSYDFASEGELILENVNGSVEVTAWDEERVQLIAEKQASASSTSRAQEAVKKVKIEVNQTANSLEIKTYDPFRKRGKGISRLLSGDFVSVSVTYTLMVPRKTDLNLETVNGTISIEEVKGAHASRTVNGAIKVNRASGSFDGKTTNGSIKVELEEVEPSSWVSLKTVNGSVNLSLPPEVRADVRVRTVNGSISTDFPLEVLGRFSRRRLQGSINGGGAEITLETVNGSVHLLKLTY